MIKASDMPYNIDLKDMKMLGSLSFEKGKVSMKYESFTETRNCKLCSTNKRRQPAP